MFDFCFSTTGSVSHASKINVDSLQTIHINEGDDNNRDDSETVSQAMTPLVVREHALPGKHCSFTFN